MTVGKGPLGWLVETAGETEPLEEAMDGLKIRHSTTA